MFDRFRLPRHLQKLRGSQKFILIITITYFLFFIIIYCIQLWPCHYILEHPTASLSSYAFNYLYVFLVTNPTPHAALPCPFLYTPTPFHTYCRPGYRSSSHLFFSILCILSNLSILCNLCILSILCILFILSNLCIPSLLHQPASADVAIGTEGLVVQEVLPIVHIGTTQLYERTLTEEDGKLPFQVRRLPATQIAIITKSQNLIQFVDGSKVRHTLFLFHFYFTFISFYLRFYFILSP